MRVSVGGRIVGEDKGKIKYEMLCKKCGYRYWVKTYKKYRMEICPVCGYLANFDDFVVEVKEDG